MEHREDGSHEHRAKGSVLMSWCKIASRRERKDGGKKCTDKVSVICYLKKEQA